MLRIIGNGLLFNVSWFAIVYSQSLPIALAVVAAHLGAHAMFWSRERGEWLFIGLLACVGALLDQVLFAAGVFSVNGQASLAPLWLSCLWPVLATTFSHAFSGLQQRPLLAAVAGAIGGAGSYIAGTRISVVDFGSDFYGPILMALIWALLFPALLRLAAVFHHEEGSTHATA